ncbi:hypothetical protein VM1G_06218 [Cytospora mali]|uniref:Uncharacterized protein n=1 Tax=Cytospora mali TaxID=578113 RepID=A0A194W1U5_CYTMA|nr:hypothetical protein VM1G_06218 [Valsa mali]
MLLLAFLCITSPLLGLVSGRVLLTPEPGPEPDFEVNAGINRECYQHNGHILYCVGDDVATTTTITLVPETVTTTTTTSKVVPTSTFYVTAPPVTQTKEVTETTTTTTTSTAGAKIVVARDAEVAPSVTSIL